MAEEDKELYVRPAVVRPIRRAYPYRPLPPGSKIVRRIDRNRVIIKYKGKYYYCTRKRIGWVCTKTTPPKPKSPIEAIVKEAERRVKRWLDLFNRMVKGRKLSVDEYYEFWAITTQSLFPIGLAVMAGSLAMEAYKKWQESQKKG